jgi:polyhydroxybutyrate depolymerase
MKSYRFFILIMVCLWLASCNNLPVKNTLIKQTIEVDGKNREYILYLPGKLPLKSPLLIAIHGYTDNDSSFMQHTSLNKIANENGFAVCYPQGLRDSSGKTFWQVGYSFHRNEKVDDVRFLSYLTSNLQKQYGFDPDRTFVTGMSNGGDMCILLACKRPELFKAVAAVSGCMMQVNYDSCASAIPIPVMMINGTADSITWWNGDLNDRQHYGPYLQVRSTFNFFVRKNGCTEKTTDTIPDIHPNDKSFIIVEKHSGGVNNNKVWLYTVVNGGHDWIGKTGNMDVQASEEIWKFFRFNWEK